MSVTPLPSSYENYIRNGWSLVPVPPGTKGPRTPGWNKKENAMRSNSVLLTGYGVGLMHAYSGTMALDVDSWPHAKEMLADQGVDLDALYAAPDAVTIESGNPGHGKLLYAMPFGLTLPSKKINYEENSVNKVAFELRCASLNGLSVQDILPPSTHVSTGKQYTWGGKGNWTRLPTIPLEILSLWESLLKGDGRKQIKSHAGADTSWDEIKSALFTISPDCSRDVWVTCGMALHSAGTEMNQLDFAMNLWDDWSAQSTTKYKGQNDIAACWRSFKAEDGITLGSLFHHARQYGWLRPLADASTMFAAVQPAPPKVVGAYMRPPPPATDLDLWPAALVRRAKEIGETRGCDPLVPLMSGLAAVCGAADSRIRLELMYEFEVPPVLWVMTIGEPADKKTPGSKPMFDVLSEIERSDIDRFNAEMLMWEVQEARYANEKKALLIEGQNPLEALNNNTPVTLAPLPPQPVPVRITVSDITSQKLVRAAQDRPRGLLCYLDEMAGWVHKINDKTSGDDRSAWVRGFEASEYKFDRVTAGTINVPHFAVSMYGNIQPNVLRENMRLLSSDGLLQRFIPVVLRREFTRRPEPIAPFLSNRSEYDDLIRKIYTLPVQTYRLSPGAYELFRDFQTWYENIKQDERTLKSDDVYMTALGKIEGVCGRLALVFHLIQDPYSLEVPASTMEQAIRVVKGYVIPSYRYVYNIVGGMADESLDQWIMDHVIQYAGEQPTLTLSEIRRSARRRIEKMSPYQADHEIIAAMDWLQTQGWVVLVDDTRKRMTWAINPQLAITFAEERRKIIDAKQRVLDSFVNCALSRGEIKAYMPTKVVGNR